MSDHAFLAPSSAATWVHCAAAPSMAAQFPERGADKTAAEEGTAAHWVFAEMFAGRGATVGQVAPNGVPVTDEMIDGAAMYLETVYSSPGQASNPVLYVEQRVTIPSVHELNWGTPDTWFADFPQRTIYLFDYKFGFGHVDEFENWQLVDYTAGIIDKLQLDGLAEQNWWAEMTIVQPRSYHRDGPVRTWRVRVSDLRAQINKLRSAAERVVQEFPATATPNDNCEHCSGRHACPALQREGYRAADASERSLPDEMTPQARALELHYLSRALKRLEARVSGLSDSVHNDLARGEAVQFFALEQSVGRLTWSVPPAEVVTLGHMLGANLEKPGIVTPTQAKEVFKKSGLDPAILAGYSANPRGALQLVAVDPKSARKAFQK